MAFENGGMSPADFAALNGGGGMGGFGNGWWIILLFVILFGGWGNRGYTNSGAENNYVLVSDFAQVERKLDTITNGICDATFALNNTIVNGNNGTQMALMQGNNAIQSQIADCCCKTQTGIQGINYAISMQTRDVLENANANTRAILDKMCAQELEAKNAKIAEQAQTINALTLASSQARQNEYLISQLRPAPIPAFSVPNPYVYNNCGCGC